MAEQVQSGFRLAGWLLLTLAFIYALLLCAGFLVGKGEYTTDLSSRGSVWPRGTVGSNVYDRSALGGK